MRLFGAEKWQISGIGQEKTFRLPKRREPGYALIDFEIELRLSEGLARKSFFIEKNRTGSRAPLTVRRPHYSGRSRRKGE